MKIKDIFRSPIDRRIEEVIKVDLGDEDTVAYELSEYVVTEHLRQEFEKVLDVYQETINKPGETTNIWVSGFFGSGKSSFAKVLGYLLENPAVKGKPAVDRFFERIEDARLRALLSTIHAQAPSLAVFLDLSSSKNVLREGESIVLPLYRALLDRLGYARDFVLAHLEFDLESDGQLAAFEKKFTEVTGRPWTERRHVTLARNEASHALHLLRPDTYPAPDSWARTVADPEINADFLAARALDLLARRAPDAKRLVFVVDEVGQYVARDEKRMFDLMGLAHAVQKKRGRIWLVVTSQEKLEDVVDSIEGKQVELARVKDRFQVTVDLVPSDIEEVVSRRVLEKKADAAAELRRRFQAHRNKLGESIRLDSPTRQRDLSEEEFVRLYPLVPYQIQLFIDAVSAHRAKGGAGPMLGGSNRTLIKLAQQMVVHQKTRLGERELGSLATVDMAYDLLESIIPTAQQAEIDAIGARHGQDSVSARVAKAVALVSGVPALRLEAQNLAALLHPAVDAESLRDKVVEALDALTQEEVLRRTDDGYKLQSPEEKDWERERRSIDMKPAQWHRIRREILKQLLEGLSVDAGRTFRVDVTVDGERILDGDLSVAIEEHDEAFHDDLRARSREKGTTLFWAYRPSDATVDVAREFHRSAEIIRRREGGPKSAGEVELLGEERVRRDRAEEELRRRLDADLLAGTIFFQGVDDEPSNGDLRSALKNALGSKVPRIYPRLQEVTAPARRADALTILRADTLDGLPSYLSTPGLGIVRIGPEGTSLAVDRDPLAAVLAEIKGRASYGLEASGKYLEEHFGGPPWGATVEVVEVLVAALLRAGAIEAISQGARIRDPRDPRLERVFNTLPGFRATTFVPQREVDPDMRARVGKRLQELTGERPPIAADQLARRIRDTFAADREALAKSMAALQALGVPVPEAIQRASTTIERFADSDDEEVIRICDETWGDLKDGRAQARRIAGALDEDALALVRSAQEIVRRGPEGLGPQAEERIARLRELLADATLIDHLGEIRSLASEHRQALTEAWGETADALRQATGDALNVLRSRYTGKVDEAALAEALRPLKDLAPAADATPETGPGLEVLRNRLRAVEGLVAQADAQLADLASTVEVVHVRARDLFDAVVTSEEDLEALLERIRQTAQEALAKGKHFRLS